MENPLCLTVFADCQSFGDHFGDGVRDANGGQGEQKRVNLIARAVITVADIAEAFDIRDDKAVYQPQQLDDNLGHQDKQHP